MKDNEDVVKQLKRFALKRVSGSCAENRVRSITWPDVFSYKVQDCGVDRELTIKFRIIIRVRSLEVKEASLEIESGNPNGLPMRCALMSLWAQVVTGNTVACN